MAFNYTTFAAAVALNDKTVLVASATGVAAGSFIRAGFEMMQVTKDYTSGTTVGVLRGQDGTQQLAHTSGEFVSVGLATDFAVPGIGGPAVTYPNIPSSDYRTYALAGAITLPSAGRNMVAELIGTGVLAMTVAAPTKELAGCRLFIAGNGKAAHTVTFATGLGAVGATADVATFKADQQQGIEVIACGLAWIPSANVAGAATIAGVGRA